MTAPLTEAWFAEARDLVAALPARPGTDAAIQFEAGDVRWHLVIEDGRITRWDLGVLDHPQITVRMPIEVAEAVHRPGADGNATLAACTLVEADGTEGVASPLDVGNRSELAQLPHLPGADLTVQYHLADGPFGDVDIWWAFRSGRSHDIALGCTTDADVEVWVPFQVVAPVRSGELSILEALERDGRVEGSEGPLMLYAGLEESPEMGAVGRACGPSGAVFGALGLVTADPVFQDALVRLAAATP